MALLTSLSKNYIEFYKNINHLENIKEGSLKLIIKELNEKCIVNMCLVYLIRIVAFSNIENTNNVYLIQLAKEIDSNLIKRHLYIISRKENNEISYSYWYNNWSNLSVNVNKAKYFNNKVYIVSLDTMIITLLINANIIDKKLITISRENKQYILVLSNKELLNQKNKTIVSLPNKFSIIVKPKPYFDAIKEDYLLNNVKYCKDIIRDKNCYALSIEINKFS